MDVDARYSVLREKLDTLGFTQPLPIGSLAVVTAILDDLILTTNSLKHAKREIIQLKEEKTAWELGVEPYKCDNSKLLAECNSLHLEIIKQRDDFQAKIFEFNKTIRNYKIDNRLLEEQCAELNFKLNDLEQHVNDPKYKKNRNDQLNLNRKPFISTVRSGEFLPSTLKLSDGDSHCSKCSHLNTLKFMTTQLDNEKEVNRVKSQLELVELYKKQIQSRDREIKRLNGLLIGGRPPSALAKDCCYRDVGSLTDDIGLLQRQKSKLQTNLEECLERQHEAMERAMRLEEKNKSLTKELNDLKNVALSVETEANSSLSTLHKRNCSLKEKLEESKRKIRELEEKVSKFKIAHEDSSERPALKKAVKEANLEIKFLQDKLERAFDKEESLKLEVDRLTKKSSKLKLKIAAVERGLHDTHDTVRVPDTRNVGTMTTRTFIIPENQYDVDRLRIDRDFYQKEYLKLVSRPNNETEVELLRNQLSEKQFEIKTLRQELGTLNDLHRTDTALSSRSVQSTIHRIERERNSLQQNLDHLTSERNELRENLQLTTKMQKNEFIRYEQEIEELKLKIKSLESENRNLQTVQVPSKTTITLLREEINQLQSRIHSLEEENIKLRTSNKQFKILQEQTESVLSEHKSRLMHNEAQLNHAESRLSLVDSNRSEVCREVGELRSEVASLRTANANLEREKDKFIIELDSKTEKIYHLELQLDKSKSLIIELESQVASTSRQLDDANSERKHKEGSLAQVASETENLRKQIAQLKRLNDNSMAENSRLMNELGEIECNHSHTKTKLHESEKEVDRLKSQLQQYVQEVQRAEELLLRKEEEREEMLDHYRSLSHDAVILEGNNHSLELEAAETKRNLIGMEDKVSHLQSQLNAREKDLSNYRTEMAEYKNQIKQLEKDIESLRCEKSTLKKELNAVKELCNKLDIEKDKLNAEVNEYAGIRRELERENEKLRNEVLMCKAGDNAAIESLQHLLTASRKEIDDQRVLTTQANKDLAKLHERITELQERIKEEHANAVRNETLAKEYSLQIQELRNQLTDSRFNQVRTKDDDRFSSL